MTSGWSFAGQSKTFVDGVGRADDVDVALALEHRGDAFAHDRMIVDDEDAESCRPLAEPAAEPSR